MKRGSFRQQSPEEKIAKARAKQAKASLNRKPKKKPLKSTTATNKKKRKVKTPRQKANDKIWELCKQIIRRCYPNTCYTCGAEGLEAQNWQTGHGKPKGSLPIRYQYDLRNLRPQCYNCNMNLGGMTDIFIAKMENEEDGLDFLQDACRQTEEGWVVKKESDLYGKEATLFLEDLIEQYKKLYTGD